jgi:hypothetical protein
MKAPFRRSVDKAMDAYIEWREQCLRVGEAYDVWTSAARGGAIGAFCAYTVALDREERAAEVYARQIQRVARLVGRKPAIGLDAAARAARPR